MSQSPPTRVSYRAPAPRRNRTRPRDAEETVAARGDPMHMPGGYSGSLSSMAAQHMVEVDEDTQAYFCPICGIELSLDDFARPEAGYYCPYCSTRQTPAAM